MEEPMANDFIPLGAVADRGAAMLEIRCGRCNRDGRSSVKQRSVSSARICLCATLCGRRSGHVRTATAQWQELPGQGRMAR